MTMMKWKGQINLLLFVFIWNCVSAITKDDCPANIRRDKYTAVYGNTCYRFERGVEKEYDDAQDYCEERGGSLALVKSSEINAFLERFLSHLGYDGRFWIGLNDMDDEGDFEWVDGTRMDYRNWADEDEGKDEVFGFEDCVAMDVGSDGKWRDYRCDDVWIFKNEHKKFVCEYKVEIKKEPTTVPTTISTSTTRSHTTTSTTRDVTHLVSKTTVPVTRSTTTVHAVKTASVSTSTLNSRVSIPIVVSEVKTLNADKTSAASSDMTTTMAAGTSTSTLVSEGRQTTTPVVTAATPTTVPLITTTCQTMNCDLDCGMSGYKSDKKGCTTCACNPED